MKLSVKISESIIKRLANITNSCCGKLYGIPTKDSLFIISLQVDIANTDTDSDFINALPTGIELCGNFIISAEASIKKQPAVSKSVLLTHAIENSDGFSFYIEHNGQYIESDYDLISEQEINSTFLIIRLKGEIPLKCELSMSQIKEAFQIIHKTVVPDFVYSIMKSNVFILENSNVGIEDDIGLLEFCEEYNNFGESFNRVKNKIMNVKPRILEINILQQLTKKSDDILKEHAPIVILEKYGSTVIDTILQLDSLVMVHDWTKISQLYDILVNSSKKILKLHELKLLDVAEDKINTKNSKHNVYHFYPEDCNHFITLLYPEFVNEKDLKSYRENLHRQLLIGSPRPCFRKSNKYIFDRNPNSPLINPHEGLKNTDNDGTVALVKGKYEYYHYCQNNMDDSGWGCAYRSLQTLASWFKLQGFVDRDVPTYKEIQQCLVDIKDKPANFVGSKQWIGSTEVNFVLNTLLGVQNKILYVSSGADMDSYGPELVNHFQNHGSPIMIGGGVLAHTILGVDYNQQTGIIKFLILDPHYTGSEDISIIQRKGWCGWKNLDFWNKTSYYNMCMPLVPREV
ncbi:ufm1-specific protease 2 [Diorhabda sublineata]|uniref:ufm1-specific protease 2 n=1 Tax=Diorhabda sublineata TaxID=1163346 RepID=UPI0024E143E2|nr:ufm1-specific protease 2 [Diorhabda sublineata]